MTANSEECQNDRGATKAWGSQLLAMALPASCALFGVMLQRHWGSNATPLYLFCVALSGLMWFGHWHGKKWAEHAVAALDACVFVLLVGALLLISATDGPDGSEIMAELLFWAPLVCIWWAFAHFDQPRLTLVMFVVFYAGLFFTQRYALSSLFHEQVIRGVLIVGLARFAAGGIRAAPERQGDRPVECDPFDHVTGLSAPVAFESDLAQITALANRYGLPFSLIILGIDEFQRQVAARDAAGRETLFKDLAWQISDRLRTPDTVARWKDDAFVLLLPNTPLIEAVKVGRSLQAAIAAAQVGKADAVSVSVGICEHSQGVEAMSLMEAAEAALQQARQKAPSGLYASMARS